MKNTLFDDEKTVDNFVQISFASSFFVRNRIVFFIILQIRSQKQNENQFKKQSVVNIQKKIVNEKHRMKIENFNTSIFKIANFRISQAKTVQIRFANDENNDVFKRQSKTMILNETNAYNRLNIIIKRYYLIFLFNIVQNESMKTIFSNMKFHETIYKTIKKNC